MRCEVFGDGRVAFGDRLTEAESSKCRTPEFSLSKPSRICWIGALMLIQNSLRYGLSIRTLAVHRDWPRGHETIRCDIQNSRTHKVIFKS